MRNLAFIREESSASLDNPPVGRAPSRVPSDASIAFENRRSRIGQIWSRYRWRMRHYFYIHLCVFWCNAMLCGAIVWLIEAERVPYIDCWFISATCVFTCGLQTYDFGSFRLASQIVMLGFTLISGITVSTIPAVLIKLYRAKREVSSSEETSSTSSSDIESVGLPVRQFLPLDALDPILRKRLQSLPSPQHLRVRAYVILIAVILTTCCTIYLCSFIAVGLWLHAYYDLYDFSATNTTISPFYASVVIAVTSFNQNGLAVWKKGMTVFVTDVFMNITVMIVVMSGTSLFPAILRGIVGLCKYLVPWRYKIFFDYILLNNHRLSAVMFPSVQTRLYVMITILMQMLGVAVALVLDFNNPYLKAYAGGQRFMIFMFQTVNTRFGGYASINISELAAGTLLIFIVLMGSKPQMLCTINETPFEMEWALLQTQEKLESGISDGDRRQSIEIFLPFHRMKHYLLRKGSITRAEAKKYFSVLRRTERIDVPAHGLPEKRPPQRRYNAFSAETNGTADGSENTIRSNGHISFLRMKLFVITFCRHLTASLFSLLTSTRTWLFIFIFLISVFEAPRTAPNNPSITMFRLIFEVFSAFGGCGLSMGYSTLAPSLAAVLGTWSKIALILVMCMGRHRGLLDSMKDQEEIEYSAQTLIDSWRRIALQEEQQRRRSTNDQSMTVANTPPPTPILTTRF